MTEKRSILCFGDSLTWGWIPVEGAAPSARYPLKHRWTGAMAAELGSGYTIIEEGLCARTTSADDPNDPRLNGSDYLPSALASHLPLDLVILMLGTNDAKCFFHRSAYEIAYGMAKLVGQVLASAGGIGTTYPAPRCLVIAPPPVAPMPHPFFAAMYEGGHEKTAALAEHYRNLADFMNVDFLDAGAVTSTDGVDGIHLTVENNLALGKAIAVRVRDMFSGE